MTTMRSFRVEKVVYRLDIFVTEDDRTEVIDEERETIMTFTANCEVYIGKLADGKRYGRTTMRGNFWMFEADTPENAALFEVIGRHRDIYDLEAAVAIRYIEAVHLPSL